MTMDQTQQPENLPDAVAKAVDGLPLPWWLKISKGLSKVIGNYISPEKAKKVSSSIDHMQGASLVTHKMYQTIAERWSADPSKLARLEDRLTDEIFGRQDRLEEIARLGVEELKLLVDHTGSGDGPNESIPADDVSEDWQRKFATFAGDVSEPEMQQVWGRILAGEIKSPGTFSIRTMRLMSEIDQKAAQDIAKFCSYVVAGDHLLDSKDWHEGPMFKLLNEMIDLGIAGNGPNQVVRKVNAVLDHSFILIGRGNLVEIVALKPPPFISYNVINLTKVGREVLKLCGPESDREHLVAVANLLNTKLKTPSFALITPVGPIGSRGPAEFLWGKESSAEISKVVSASRGNASP